MENTPNRMIAQILGAVLVLIGLLGFVGPLVSNGVPPFTTTAENSTDFKLLGIFAINGLHNLVHLATGLFLLAGAYAMGGANARKYNISLGVVYLIVAIAGLAIVQLRELVAIDTADHVLHAVLAIVLLGVAFAVKETIPGGGAARRRTI